MDQGIRDEEELAAVDRYLPVVVLALPGERGVVGGREFLAGIIQDAEAWCLIGRQSGDPDFGRLLLQIANDAEGAFLVERRGAA